MVLTNMIDHGKVQCTVEPHYDEVLGIIKVGFLCQDSHYITVKKQRNIKSWDQQGCLVVGGFCYIRPLYNEVPLYSLLRKQILKRLVPNPCSKYVGQIL